MVMAMANLAMVTGNLGRGASASIRCAARTMCRARATWARSPTNSRATAMSRTSRARMFETAGASSWMANRACAFPTCSMRRSTDLQGAVRAGRGHRPVRSQHPPCVAALSAMECVVVQDLFLNETANFAHVFLPGSTFLEKDGTFTNAERRIQRVRKVMPPRGLADWEITFPLERDGLSDELYASLRDHGRDRRPHADLYRRVLREARRIGLGAVAVQRQGAPGHADHAHRRFVRGKGKFVMTEYVPTDERTGPRFPLLLTTGRILCQYNVGAQTRRTANVAWHRGGRLEIHPHDAEHRGIRDGDWVDLRAARARPRCAR